jgi:FkbM family methyltransferase
MLPIQQQYLGKHRGMDINKLPWLDRLSCGPEPTAMQRFLASYHPALANLPSRIAILGAAEEGQRLVSICDRHDIDIAVIVDDAPERQGTMIGSHTVDSRAVLDSLDRDTPVVIASHLTLNASQSLKAQGFRNVSPFPVLQILHGEMFAPHMFYTGWSEDLLANQQRYADLARRLADDASRRVLDAVFAYRQTLVPETLAHVIRDKDPYLAADLFTFRQDEIYVDGGAFDGDTIRLFIERTGGHFRRILGFEPDPTTFSRLAANFAEDQRVVPVNAGLWSRADTLHFRNNAGRASILDSIGEVMVNVLALDDMLDGEGVSFIKMNIEGAELEALRGAASSICRFLPKLAIAAYHRPSDLWEVAKVVDEIAPGYDFYLRQHCGGVVETVLYAVHN